MGKGGERTYLRNITVHAYPDVSSRATLDISSPCPRIRNTKVKGFHNPTPSAKTVGSSWEFPHAANELW